MTQSAYSLRRRLMLWIGVPVLIAGLLVALLAFIFSWHEVEEVYDAQLVHSAKFLLQLTEYEILENGRADIKIGDENPNLQHRYENKTAFRIWHEGRLVTQSAKAAAFGDFQAPPGFSDQTLKEKPWRFFVFIDPGKDIRIETSERYAIRYEMIGQLMISLAVPLTLFVPLILLIVWVSVRKSLKPVIILSRTVDRRHSDDLSPVKADDIPQEIMPLPLALNRLFLRIGDSFRREREFTDHAAHELRTPLAAMKTQAQVLLKKAGHIPEYHEGLDNLVATINRSTHLVEQLLSLARLQHEQIELAPLDLSSCLRDLADEFMPAIRSKGLNMQMNVADHVMIEGHGESLSILIRNILDNAVKYTPAGGMLSADLSPDAVLTIRDTGPGLPDPDKERVFGRFVRADKTGQTGSGLGLSIVQSIAQGHGITVDLSDNQPRGLMVRIAFRKIAA